MSTTHTHADGMKLLTDRYPGWDCPVDTAKSWIAEMSEMPAEVAYEAARLLSKESKYPPSLAEWYQRATALQDAEDGEDALTPAEAWDELMRNRRLRYTKQPEWSSEATMRAAKAVDWASSEWLTEQLPTIRAQFERYYSSIVEKTRKIDAMNDVRNSSERVQRRLGQGNAEGTRKLFAPKEGT